MLKNIAPFAGKSLFMFLWLFLGPVYIYAQNTSITDSIINVYTAVTGINADNCTITVASNAEFALNDRVLLIQMKGAVINSSNSSDFGNITDTLSAGNYELNYVCELIGSTQIRLVHSLSRSYDVSGKVQLVGIPQQYYNTNLFIDSNLTSKAWDGTTGGVLYLEALEDITLNADIDVGGKGFRGGASIQADNICSWSVNHSDYYYELNDHDGGKKGEGIAEYILNKEFGRGAQANGGGGGNNHNAGGAGGGNWGAGGAGGRNNEPSFGGCKGYYPGIGGRGLINSRNNIYLGGGGGAGHRNNNDAGQWAGANGGGIILISSEQLKGNGHNIYANGSSAGNSLNDGAGGGGAGGSIFLDISTYDGTNIYLEVKGGNGGNAQNDGAARCFGPGGGGGAGIIIFNTAPPVNISFNLSGGSPGITTQSSSTCNGSNNSATAGLNGDTLISYELFSSTSYCTGCISPFLPVEWIAFHARAVDRQAHLEWIVALEKDVEKYVVQRSPNGRDFTDIIYISPTNATANEKIYRVIDEQPLSGHNYYRIKNIDFNGEYSYSPLRSVLIQEAIAEIYIAPNPVSEQRPVQIAITANYEEVAEVIITNTVGQVVHRQRYTLQKGANTTHIPAGTLAPGIYYAGIQTSSGIRQVKFVVQ